MARFHCIASRRKRLRGAQLKLFFLPRQNGDFHAEEAAGSRQREAQASGSWRRIIASRCCYHLLALRVGIACRYCTAGTIGMLGKPTAELRAFLERKLTLARSNAPWAVEFLCKQRFADHADHCAQGFEKRQFY